MVSSDTRAAAGPAVRNNHSRAQTPELIGDPFIILTSRLQDQELSRPNLNVQGRGGGGGGLHWAAAFAVGLPNEDVGSLGRDVDAGCTCLSATPGRLRRAGG